ncbi:MAG TPA: carbohydrate ABC transporter permease [Gaiella sp.]|jgi:raffinose/stachyose/melibiose transport system permease protein
MRARYTWRAFSRELIFLALAAFFCIPFYLLFSIALKPNSELFTSPLSFPTSPDLGNFSEAWKGQAGVGLGRAMFNSLVITVFTVAILILIGSLCAYALARRPSRLSNALYFMFVLGIIIPFQLGIVPLYVLFRKIDLIGSYLGMITLWVGVSLPVTVFLYTGFIRALPRDYEEAAQVDGAGVLRTYLRVVFPLLRPVTGTVAILTGLFVWNDFFISLIFVSGSDRVTLPVAVYAFVGEYFTQYNLVFAAVTIALLPIMIFFVFAQRQLIRGFTSGVRG